MTAFSDPELDELERLELLVRGPPWEPDIDEPGTEREAWTGKWYTAEPAPGKGCSWATYAADEAESVLHARYLAALRNAAPRLLRAARRLRYFDTAGLVAENETLRRRLVEVERERDEQRERAEAGVVTVMGAFKLSSEYYEKRDELRRLLGAEWFESLEEAAARLAAREPGGR